MEDKMTSSKLLYAGIAAVTLMAAPAFAQEATQEPAAMGQNYSNSDYLTGGYGVRATPGPRYYFRRDYGPAVYGPPAVVVTPYEATGSYNYYGGRDY
jgi:putative salt-induced outer membrane protein YdiY